MSDVNIEAVLDELEAEQHAFELFMAGYQQRLEDESVTSTKFHDREKFAQHIRETFWREYDE